MSAPENEHTPQTRSLLERRRKVKPTSVTISQSDIVMFDFLQPDQQLPLVIRPRLPGLQLASWVESNQALVEQLLLKHGGILFRGFPLATQIDFEEYLAQVKAPLMQYIEGATPRIELGKQVYTSTIFPQDQKIALHNELSYVMTWPIKIWFFSVEPAESGGETPLADVRKVYNRIDLHIRKRFEQKGWKLVRNYGDGFGLPWQVSFHTDDKEAVTAYCREARVDFEWREGDHLRTSQVRPAVIPHPTTGEMLWFNHIAFWHVSSLDPSFREVFLSEFSADDLPYNTFYGDGTPIEPEVVAAIHQAYDQETVAFPWQRGDLLMLDNMLVAHGRNPFTGSRMMLTAMGGPYTRQDC